MSRPLKIDRELAFRKWVELRTLENVVTWLYENGIHNKGKPFSRAAVSKAARRWVCLNAQEAREIYAQHDWMPEDDDWYEWLLRTAMRVFHDHKRHIFEKILDDNNIRDKYGYIIGEGTES